MTIPAYIAIGVILLMIVALIKEIMSPGLILFSALVVFMITDILVLKRPSSGFSNKGMITVALLFLVSEGVKESGVLNTTGSIILPKKRKPIPQASDADHDSGFGHICISEQYTGGDYFRTHAEKMGR